MIQSASLRNFEPLFLPSLLFILLFFSGILTVCPTIYWRDAPEFVDVVQTLGIPHPAGSPSYILLAKLITFLPLGNLALRINLVSVFGQGLTMVLFFILAQELIRSLFSNWSPSNIRLGAFIASLNFGLSPSFWLVSSFSEVYSMNSVFFIGLVLCSVTFWKTKDLRFLYLGGVVYGLSSGVHATVVFYLPAFVYLFFKFVPKKKWGGSFFWVSLFFIWGFSVYLYLPIRSLANPPFDWGNPETFSQFLIHITDRKTQSDHFDYKVSLNVGYYLVQYFGHLIREIGWLGIIPAIFGIFIHGFKEKSMFSFLWILVFGNLIFYLNWKTGDGFIPSNLILSLWASLGFSFFLEKISKRKRTGIFAIRWNRVFALTVFLFLFCKVYMPGFSKGVNAFQYANKSNFYNAYEMPRMEYQKITPDGVAISTLFWFPFRYFQDIERFREDISIVMASDIIGPKFFNPVTANRFPKLNIPEDDPFETPWHDYMPKLIQLNISEKSIFYEPHLTLVRPIYKNLVPQGFLFQVRAGVGTSGISQNTLTNYLEQIRTLIHTEMLRGDLHTDINSKEYYMSFLLFISDYLILHGHFQEARYVLNIASEIRPNQGTVDYYLGKTDILLGDVYRGVRRLEALIARESHYPYSYFVLGQHYLKMGDLEEARYNLLQARKMGMKGEHLDKALLEFYWRSGNLEKAHETLRRMEEKIQSEDDRENFNSWKEILKDAQIH